MTTSIIGTKPPAAEKTPEATAPTSTTTPEGVEETQEEEEEESDEEEEDEGERLSLSRKKLKDRLDRKGRAAQKDLLKELGVANVDDLKNALRERDSLKTSQLTEKEQLELKLAESEKARKAAERRLELDTLAKQKDESQKFLKDVATQHGVDPDAFELVAAKMEAHVAENFDGDDDLTPESFKSFFKTLKKEKKHYFAPQEEEVNTSVKKKEAPSSPAKQQTKAVEDMTDAEFRAYKRAKGLRAD